MEAKYLEISGRTYYAFEEPDFIGPMPLRVIPKKVEPLLTFKKCIEGDVDAGFWRRQFGRVVTAKQRKYDWIFGVFMPAVCIFFDPFVFRSWYHDTGILAGYSLFAYLLSGSAIMGLAAWLLWGERLEELNAPLGGLFVAAGIVAALIGIPLLPISIIGSVFVVGFLGFTPLLTSIILLRNGVRSLRAASPFFEKPTLGYVVAIAGLASIVIPWLANQALNPNAGRAIGIMP